MADRRLWRGAAGRPANPLVGQITLARGRWASACLALAPKCHKYPVPRNDWHPAHIAIAQERRA